MVSAEVGQHGYNISKHNFTSCCPESRAETRSIHSRQSPSSSARTIHESSGHNQPSSDAERSSACANSKFTSVADWAYASARADVAGDRLPRATVRTRSCLATAAGGIVFGFCLRSALAAGAALGCAFFITSPAFLAFFFAGACSLGSPFPAVSWGCARAVAEPSSGTAAGLADVRAAAGSSVSSVPSERLRFCSLRSEKGARFWAASTYAHCGRNGYTAPFYRLLVLLIRSKSYCREALSEMLAYILMFSMRLVCVTCIMRPPTLFPLRSIMARVASSFSAKVAKPHP